MWLHRFLFRSQHNTMLRLDIELDKSLARVAAIDREANIKQETITRLGKEASALEHRVKVLESRLSMEKAAMTGALGTIREFKTRVRKLLLASFDESGSVELRVSMEKLADMCGLERTAQSGEGETDG